jgi:hypothetical protein
MKKKILYFTYLFLAIQFIEIGTNLPVKAQRAGCNCAGLIACHTASCMGLGWGWGCALGGEKARATALCGCKKGAMKDCNWAELYTCSHTGQLIRPGGQYNCDHLM